MTEAEDSPLPGGLLKNRRVYLSGPMDFVASRAEEKKRGWRSRVGDLLRSFGATVFDPWDKPEVLGLHQYGREDEATIDFRERWTFEPTPDGAGKRAECAKKFWETMHIDLRMVDHSDFVIAFCPTNIYSVGTVHEIVVARQQRKPVLLVTIPVSYPTLDALRTHLGKAGDAIGLRLLGQLTEEVPVKANPKGIPSLWYMALVNSESVFDGFGFTPYQAKHGWAPGPLDDLESRLPPKRPLLPFLEGLDRELPKKWSVDRGGFVRDDDWLPLDVEQ